MLHGLARIATRTLVSSPRPLVDEARRLEALTWAALCALHPGDGDLYWRVREIWLRAAARRRRREESAFAVARQFHAA